MKKYFSPAVEVIDLFGGEVRTDIIVSSDPIVGDPDTPIIGALPNQNNNNGNI